MHIILIGRHVTVLAFHNIKCYGRIYFFSCDELGALQCCKVLLTRGTENKLKALSIGWLQTCHSVLYFFSSQTLYSENLLI